MLGQELSPKEEERHAELVQAAKLRELGAWAKCDVCGPRRRGNVSNHIVQTRWALTWRAVDGKETAKARPVSKGCQDPDLMEGNSDLAGHVSRRFSHSRAISSGALKKLRVWSLDIKNAFRQQDRSSRDVFLHCPPEWDSRDTHRFWKGGATSFGLIAAPGAFRRSLLKYLVNSAGSLAKGGFKFEVSPFGPRLSFWLW